MFVASGGQQLLKLWTEFQQAEKLHSERIRDMEERLKRVGSSSSSSFSLFLSSLSSGM